MVSRYPAQAGFIIIDKKGQNIMKLTGYKMDVDSVARATGSDPAQYEGVL